MLIRRRWSALVLLVAMLTFGLILGLRFDTWQRNFSAQGATNTPTIPVTVQLTGTQETPIPTDTPPAGATAEPTDGGAPVKGAPPTGPIPTTRATYVFASPTWESTPTDTP